MRERQLVILIQFNTPPSRVTQSYWGLVSSKCLSKWSSCFRRHHSTSCKEKMLKVQCLYDPINRKELRYLYSNPPFHCASQSTFVIRPVDLDFLFCFYSTPKSKASSPIFLSSWPRWTKYTELKQQQQQQEHRLHWTQTAWAEPRLMPALSLYPSLGDREREREMWCSHGLQLNVWQSLNQWISTDGVYKDHHHFFHLIKSQTD